MSTIERSETTQFLIDEQKRSMRENRESAKPIEVFRLEQAMRNARLIGAVFEEINKKPDVRLSELVEFVDEGGLVFDPYLTETFLNVVDDRMRFIHSSVEDAGGIESLRELMPKMLENRLPPELKRTDQPLLGDVQVEMSPLALIVSFDNAEDYKLYARRAGTRSTTSTAGAYLRLAELEADGTRAVLPIIFVDKSSEDSKAILQHEKRHAEHNLLRVVLQRAAKRVDINKRGEVTLENLTTEAERYDPTVSKVSSSKRVWGRIAPRYAGKELVWKLQNPDISEENRETLKSQMVRSALSEAKDELLAELFLPGRLSAKLRSVFFKGGPYDYFVRDMGIVSGSKLHGELWIEYLPFYSSGLYLESIDKAITGCEGLSAEKLNVLRWTLAQMPLDNLPQRAREVFLLQEVNSMSDTYSRFRALSRAASGNAQGITFEASHLAELGSRLREVQHEYTDHINTHPTESVISYTQDFIRRYEELFATLSETSECMFYQEVCMLDIYTPDLFAKEKENIQQRARLDINDALSYVRGLNSAATEM